MPRPTMYKHVQSLIAPIKAVSIGGFAHEKVCGDSLRLRAASAIERAYDTTPQTTADRYNRVMHASGLVGAVGLRALVRPVTLPLDLLVGTGRHRYTGPERLTQNAFGHDVHYVEAMLDHPLDTGLLGLISAYNLAKHAMIAGSLGAAAGAVVGLVLWPCRGLPHSEALFPFVEVWVQRGAFFAGAFGALMGSCLIMAPHNYIAVQGLRVLTAVPKLLANVVGYAVGAFAALACLLACDGAASAARALGALWQSGARAPGAPTATA